MSLVQIKQTLESLQICVSSDRIVDDSKALSQDLHEIITTLVPDEYPACLSLCYVSYPLTDLISVATADHTLAKINMLNTQDALIEMVHEMIWPYAAAIMHTAKTTFTSSTANSSLKIAALGLIRTLAVQPLPDSYTLLNIHELFEKICQLYTKTLKKLTTSVRACMLEILGQLAQTFHKQLPAICTSHVERLCTSAISDLFQKHGKAIEPAWVAGALQGMNHLLYVSVPDTTTLALLAKTILNVVRPFGSLTRYDLPKAGLVLVKNHADKFATELVGSYKHMFQSLEALMGHQNKEVYKLGFAAMRSFLETISVAAANTPSESEQCIKFLFANLKSKLAHSADLRQFAMVVEVLGVLAKGINAVLGQASLLEILDTVQRRIFDIYLNPAQLSDELVNRIPSFIEGLDLIVYNLDTLPPSTANCIDTLIDTTVSSWPQLSSYIQPKAASKTFSLIFRLNKHNLCEKIWTKLAYKCLIVSSSRIETREEAADNGVLWKEYLVFWMVLADSSLSNLRETSTKINEFFAVLMRIWVNCIIRLLRNLNLEIRDGAPVNAKDYQIFLNLVDFLTYFTPLIEYQRFECVMDTLLDWLIKSIQAYPEISGFYKLLNKWFAHANSNSYFDTREKAIETKCSDFMRDVVLARAACFRDELLAACLELVLSAPPSILPVELIVKSLNSALILGLSYLPLAIVGIQAFQARLKEDFNQERFQLICESTLPNLMAYLQADTLIIQEASEEPTILGFSIKQMRRPNSEKKRQVKQPTLRDIQFDIISILGQLGKLNKSLLAPLPGSEIKQISYNKEKKPVFSIEIPFLTRTIPIFMDAMLPRVAHLALTSADRNTKVAAAELLHAAILVMIGKSTLERTYHVSRTDDPFENLWERLCPMMLALGADPDNVVRELFKTLTLQTIRWMTQTDSNTRDYSKMVQACVDSCLSPNSQLRDMGAECTAEFLKYAIKHSMSDPPKITSHTRNILEQMLYFCVHSDPLKRLVGGLIWAKIHTTIRNEKHILDQYGLEICLHFFISLHLACGDNSQLGTVSQAIESIEIVADILKLHAKYLLVRKLRRFFRASPLISDEHESQPNLQTLVEWIFTDATTTEAHPTYVQTALTLYNQLSACIPKFSKVESIKAVVAHTWIYKLDPLPIDADSCSDKYLKNCISALMLCHFLDDLKIQVKVDNVLAAIETLFEKNQSIGDENAAASSKKFLSQLMLHLIILMTGLMKGANGTSQLKSLLQSSRFWKYFYSISGNPADSFTSGKFKNAMQSLVDFIKAAVKLGGPQVQERLLVPYIEAFEYAGNNDMNDDYLVDSLPFLERVGLLQAFAMSVKADSLVANFGSCLQDRQYQDHQFIRKLLSLCLAIDSLRLNTWSLIVSAIDTVFAQS